jgi:hypothetical protein
MRNNLNSAIRDSSEYLLSHQAADGHWEEYALPVGSSDAWVTAYIGLVLQGAKPAGGHTTCHRAVRRAARWLIDQRPYPAGWGYNGQSGPDADSTAHVIGLLRAIGMSEEEGDENWLFQHWQQDGGFATFEGPKAWGCAHTDITPMCFRALRPHHRSQLRAQLLDYLGRTRREDGSWPSYWWRTGFYSSYSCLALLRDLGINLLPPLHLAEMREIHDISSAFDLAFAVGIASLQGHEALRSALATDLLRRQRTDGSWAGGAELRVTDSDCFRPWERPQGQLYSDIEGLLSTATCLSILTRL